MKRKMSGGWWLVITTTIYLIVGIIVMFGYQLPSDSLTVVYIQMMWLFISSLPLWVKPISHFCNMRLLWE